jgi:hypothetical protein
MKFKRYFATVNEEKIQAILNTSPEFLKDFPLSANDDLLYYLVEKGIYEIQFDEIEPIEDTELELQFSNNPETIEKIEFYNMDNEISPPIKLIEEVNKFLLNKYRNKVVQKKIDILEQFEETVYGLEFHEEKKIGLELFNNLYSSFNIKIDEKPFEYQYNERTILYLPTKLFKLYRFRLGYLIEKTTLEIILPYLTGQNHKFDDNFYNQYKEIEQLITFELNIEIIRMLNSRFEFEKDIYFNNFFNYSMKEICFNNIFREYAYVFSMIMLENLDEINRSNIESLYDFLENNDLYIGKKEDFMQVINLEFGTKITKIKKYEKLENRTHDERVKMLKIEWENFKKEYNKFGK